MLKSLYKKLPTLKKLSNKRYYCNVNKSDYDLLNEKINMLEKKIDFVFYLSIISSVSSIFIKAFEN